MPIKLLGLGAGWSGWNGSRTHPDGGGTNGSGGGGPDCGRCENEGGGCGGAYDGERLLLSSFGSGPSFNLFNLFLRLMSSPAGLRAFSVRSLAKSFLPTSSFF